VASLSQGRTAAAQCGLFTYKSVPVIFEPPCTLNTLTNFAKGVCKLRLWDQEVYKLSNVQKSCCGK